jgi:hypothetical protein
MSLEFSLLEPPKNASEGLSFPRLTWHTPALKYNPSNLLGVLPSAIDMPGYERYSLLSDRSFMIYNNNWESTFRYHEYYYPWLKKVDMAK